MNGRKTKAGHHDGLVIAIFIITISQTISAIQVGSVDTLNDYKPVSMIESWKYNPGKDEILKDGVPVTRPEYVNEQLSDLITNRVKVEKNPDIVNVQDVSPNNVADSLIRIPKVEDTKLTKIITGKQQPTFVQEEVVKPVINEKPTGKNKVLATYRILVPIWVPAVKSKAPYRVKKPEAVEYVKEKHTELVPVTNTVTVKKTILKAEPIPQKVVTDFVRKSGKVGRTTGGGDDLKPQEEVLDTVITRF